MAVLAPQERPRHRPGQQVLGRQRGLRLQRDHRQVRLLRALRLDLLQPVVHLLPGSRHLQPEQHL